jgi:hypothetical protein
MLVALLLACASGNSCADYVKARQACAEEAGDTTVYDPETICADWTAEQESTYGDWYKCQEQAYIAEECTDESVVLAAENNAATCPQP